MMAHFFKFGYMCNLRGTKCMELNVWEFLLDLTESICIKIQPKPGVMSSLQKQLVAAKTYGFSYFFPVSRHFGNVCIGVSGYPVEITKLAIGNAHICCIYIAVYLPGYFTMWNLFFT